MVRRRDPEEEAAEPDAHQPPARPVPPPSAEYHELLKTLPQDQAVPPADYRDLYFAVWRKRGWQDEAIERRYCEKLKERAL